MKWNSIGNARVALNVDAFLCAVASWSAPTPWRFCARHPEAESAGGPAHSKTWRKMCDHKRESL
jgi:hypothetical protein